MNDMLMIWISEDLRKGEGIVAFESVVVESRRAEDVVWLFNKPGHLRAWQNDCSFARAIGQDIGHVVLAILWTSVNAEVPD